MSTFIPTLDISKGQAVLVTNGKVTKIIGDPMKKAEFLSIHKHFQLIDIDRAMGTGDNRELIKQIVKKYPCYVGGGIRTIEDAREFLNTSARRVIISTAMNIELLKQIPKERLILAFDIDEKFHVYTKGRKELIENKTMFDYIEEFKDYVEVVTITFHNTEGTCKGLPFDQVKQIYDKYKSTNIKLIMAGGIKTIDEDIYKLFLNKITPQFGAALWEGHFTLGDVYKKLLEVDMKDKCPKTDNGQLLIPTIIQSDTGSVLSCVFSTPESLKLSVDTRRATFYSRERNKIWVKGETSGNFHEVKQVHINCDNTAIRMVVSGDKFCHKNTESCFGHIDPARGSLKSMQKIMLAKLEEKSSDKESFTLNMLNNEHKIISKIMEESQELVCAKGQDEISHESADLIYFVLLYLLKNKLDISNVEDELIKRRFTVTKDSKPVIINNQHKFKIGIIMNKNIYMVREYLSIIFRTDVEEASDYNRNFKFYCNNNDQIMVIPIKPKDIAILMNNNFIDGVVSYEDVLLNYPTNVKKIGLKENDSRKVSIVVACKSDINMEQIIEINKTRKIIIMAE